MASFFEIPIANTWNRLLHLRQPKLKGGLTLGRRVIEGRLSKLPLYLLQIKRTEHIAVLGRTGSGKTSLLKSICLSDIRAGRGFLYIDHHGDTIPFLLSAIAQEEVRTGMDFAERVVVFEPGNPDCAIGLNPLAIPSGQQAFVQTVGIAAVLKERWGLDHFGARTEELLRNALLTLAENALTLLELPHLLAHDSFRTHCVRRVSNADVRSYFNDRFDQLSPAMRAVMRDPILNKVSEFISDPHFRFILGQSQSAFSFEDALENNRIVLVDLNKGLLGHHAATLGSPLLSQFRPALFRRTTRKLFTVYADEVQNLMTSSTDFEAYLAEARKFHVGFITANQFLDQLPTKLRAAIQAVGTQIAFQISAQDAQSMSAALGGSKQLARLLSELPQRQFVVKSGHYDWQRVQTPDVERQDTPFSNLLQRSRNIYARPRADVESEIETRRPQASHGKEALDEWE